MDSNFIKYYLGPQLIPLRPDEIRYARSVEISLDRLLSIEKFTGQAPVKYASLLSIENLTGQAGFAGLFFVL